MELLVRIRDKDGFDEKANALSCRPGDVIAVCPDGWPWGAEELTNRDWRIVKMPGIDHRNHSDLMMPALDAVGNMLFKRAVKIDTSAKILSDEIAKPEQAITFASDKQASVLALKVVKPTAVTIGDATDIGKAK